MTVELKFHTGKLYNGRSYVFACLRLGRRTWFVSRWDKRRVILRAGQRSLWEQGEMVWYGGRS